MKKMKIACIKETKIPKDNRTPLTPNQIASLQKEYPFVQFVVQKSDIRCYKDYEYSTLGIPVVDVVDDCEILLGIKEVDKKEILPNKHYLFFGHIAKEQPYNQELIKTMIKQKVTFSDYEYLVDDDGQRLCSFGWWAGVVGAYNTIRAYGLRNKRFNLAAPSTNFTLKALENNLLQIKHLIKTSIIITGNGRVSKGAQYVLQILEGVLLPSDEFLSNSNKDKLTYTILQTKDLVKHKNGLPYNREDFKKNSYNYVSCFDNYLSSAEILLSCHFWGENQPIYIDENALKSKNRTINIIGDITCDIKGSILSTIRPSTHDNPFYDFNPLLMTEEPAFSNENNITVMAVDTCPNALALDASEDFGNMLSQYILPKLLINGLKDPIIQKSTILKNGCLTSNYLYLSNYANYNIDKTTQNEK
jgi:alanine dehydrogenase